MSGALEYRECVADDMVSFLQLAWATTDETVVLVWKRFESRARRDAVMGEARLKDMCEKHQMPFDYKRMAYGGFETLVEAWRRSV